MLLILVKVACQSTTATDCSHRATSMLLILVEVSVKMAQLSIRNSHRLQPQSYFHAIYSGGSICESGLSVHNCHRLQPQSYFHATYSGGSICESGLSVYKSEVDIKCIMTGVILEG